MFIDDVESDCDRTVYRKRVFVDDDDDDDAFNLGKRCRLY